MLNMETSLFITFFVALLAITNPLGSLAIFIGLVSNYSENKRKRTAKQAGIAIFVILVIVTWGGTLILSFFGITPAAFESAGALVIILLGLSMIRGEGGKTAHKDYSMHFTEAEKEAAEDKETVAVIPIAIPIVAGPGAITTIIIHSHTLHTFMDRVVTSVMCAVIALILFICFHYSGQINRIVGVNGIKITTRIMGLVLMAMAFQMLGNGLIGLMPGLGGIH